MTVNTRGNAGSMDSESELGFRYAACHRTTVLLVTAVSAHVVNRHLRAAPSAADPQCACSPGEQHQPP